MAQPNWYRKCVGCGIAAHKKELLRIVFSKTNSFQIDENQKKPGRGIYICRKTSCAKSAQQNQSLEKSLHREVDQSFYDLLIQQVEKIEHN
jgi:uncharacterized protein